MKETKLLNFYSLVGINFQNIASNDAVIGAKINEMINNLEKIKTIGDSYMCAGGLPKANRTNPVEAVLAAIEIQRFMEQTREIKLTLGEPYWGLRLGIHTGPLVAGVAGKKKFAYDIWGDTVNTASRLESSGEVGRVNISGFTYNLVKDFLTSYTCNKRSSVNS